MEDLPTIIERKRGAWTVPELAELLSLSKREVYAMVKAGRIPALRIGTSVRFCPGSTAAWLRTKVTSTR
jgi:excisionase family DNA binding protein